MVRISKPKRNKWFARLRPTIAAAPPSPYLDLLDRITAIDPSRNLATTLVALSEEPIQQQDPVALLLLAEWAAGTHNARPPRSSFAG